MTAATSDPDCRVAPGWPAPHVGITDFPTSPDAWAPCRAELVEVTVVRPPA